MWITWDTGVDWFRCTAEPGTPGYVFMGHFGTSCLERMQREGHTFEGWKWRDYEGSRCGPIRLAYRESDALFEATSSAAHQAASFFMEQEYGFKTSRIDLQVTGQTDEEIERYLFAARDEIERQTRRKATARQSAVGSTRSAGGGTCITIGKRVSPRYARLYDKTSEQRGCVADGLIRFEVEFKGKQARAIFQTLRLCHDRTRVIADLVCAHFESKGVDMSWVDRDGANKLPSTYAPTDNERRLRWIERNVAPTVRRLRDAGFGKEVAKFLDEPAMKK